jgi:hypothetical protein
MHRDRYLQSPEPFFRRVITGVKQELERSETGTMFLLNKDGLTVIRRPTVEEDFETESMANQAN